VGDGTAGDKQINFDADANDWHIGRDDTDDFFKIGLGTALGTTDYVTIDNDGDAVFSEDVYINEDSAAASVFLSTYDNTEATSVEFQLRKADGTEASPALVDDNAILGRVIYRGYDGDQFLDGATILAKINGTPADNVMPTDLEFYINTGGASATLMATFEEDGDAYFVNKGGFGRTPTQVGDFYVASGSINVLSDSASVANTESSKFVVKATGNSVENESQIGVVYYSASETDAPSGYLRIDPPDGAATYLYVDNDGDLRISETATHRGTQNGTVVGDQTASDERLKSNIQPISYGLDTVMRLEPIEFDMHGSHQLGFGAQTTQEIIPETVFDTKDRLYPAEYETQEVPEADALELVEVVGNVVETKTVQVEEIVTPAVVCDELAVEPCEAADAVTAMVDKEVPITKTKKRINKTTGMLEEYEKPVTKTVKTFEWRLKEGITLNETTGKFYREVVTNPSEETKLVMSQRQIIPVLTKAIQELRNALCTEHPTNELCN